jgi:predicted metal-dependent phosphoesterase TrpH
MNHKCNNTPAPSGPSGATAGHTPGATAGHTPGATVRVDLHCHSAASARGPLRPGAVPECATPPHEVYELAKRRGMDFVTITDHDTIDGALQIAGEPDAFVSEELTVRFPDESRSVHVLCYGITPDDHGRLQERRGDVIAVAEYLHEHEIACSLAHPFWNAEAPLTPAHRRLLARLFPVWETRNGKRPTVINAPAAVYVDTHGGGATGGSDDHSGTETGRTFTLAPAAATPAELQAHIRAGATTAHGAERSPAKTAHAALALAARTPGEPSAAVRSWLQSVELELDTGGLVAQLQSPEPLHAELERRARRIHERRLAHAVGELQAASDELAPRARAALAAWAIGDILGLGGRGRAGADVRQRGPVRVPGQHRRLRAGDPRGAGLRAARARRDRQRRVRADRERPHGLPGRAGPAGDGERDPVARSPCRDPRAARHRRAARGAPALWEASLTQLGSAYARARGPAATTALDQPTVDVAVPSEQSRAA